MGEQEQWGPWIEHDGRGGKHLAGEWLHIIGADGRQGEGMLRFGCGPASLWHWDTLTMKNYHKRVIRYRIRKPRGLTILQELIENLPVKEDA